MRSGNKQDISVLLVDDDADLRQYWGNVLDRAFRKVVTCEKGIDALGELKRGTFDVVFYDAHTPDLDGLSFCRDIRADARQSSLPVILYSGGYIKVADRELALTAGARHYIQRPSDIDSVIRMIREVHVAQRAKHTIEQIDEPVQEIGDEPSHSAKRSFTDDSQGDVARQLGQEVSTLRKRNVELELSLSRHKAFTACAADYVWETDLSHHVVFLQASHSDTLDLIKGAADKKGIVERLGVIFDAELLQELKTCFDAQREFSYVIQSEPVSVGRALAVVAKPYSSKDGAFSGFRGTLLDVTDSHKVSGRLQYEATHDSLTGLYNARAFDVTLEQALRDGQQHVLCYLDLDYFKTVNDTSGHLAGDQLLVELTQLFQAKVRNSDCLARLGGDEFGILLRNCSLDQARRLVQDLHNSVSKYRFNWQGRSFELGLSIGLVRIDNPALNCKEILAFADEACYAAKKAGRNQLHVYGEDDGSNSALGNEAFWLERFHNAFNGGGLCLYRQPILHANGRNKTRSYEVLVRMREGDKLVPPGDFLPVIERYQLSPVLDEWVVQRMLEWLDEFGYAEQGCDYYSINISGVSLCKEEFRDHVVELVTRYRHLAGRLCFEVTETAAIENLAAAIGFMTDLRSLGCRFSLDDFGTGFSSLAYLKNLPVDYLKIDGVFVTGVTSDAVDLGMLESIQHIANVLNLKTIAEYVENEDTALALQQIGIDFLQGHFVGHPEIIESSGVSG